MRTGPTWRNTPTARTGWRRICAARGPDWAAGITGLTVAEIEAFAALYGRTDRAFLRIGYGFARSRNGSANLHAVTCLPTVTGKWRHPGGGAFLEQPGQRHLPLGQEPDRGP